MGEGRGDTETMKYWGKEKGREESGWEESGEGDRYQNISMKYSKEKKCRCITHLHSDLVP